MRLREAPIGLVADKLLLLSTLKQRSPPAELLLTLRRKPLFASMRANRGMPGLSWKSNPSHYKGEETTMIGMSFWAFLVLLVASVIAAFIIHYILRYRCLEGFDGFLGQWVTGWIGAWLGSPVVGHWFGHVELAGVYLIPALIGAFAAAFLGTAGSKVVSKVFSPKAA